MGLQHWLRYCLFAAVALANAAERHGQVKFGGQPVPGATVTASQNGKVAGAITDAQGIYTIPDLTEGTWDVSVQMSGFGELHKDIAIPAEGIEWELKMLPLDAMRVQVQATPVTIAVEGPAKKATGKPTTTQTPFQRTDLTSSGAKQAATAKDDFSTAELNQRSADGLLINGTANNGAASPFAQAAAFGNFRRGPKSLYSGSLGMTLDHSSLDASPYSLTGQAVPRPDYTRLQGMLSFGGPLKIPHLLKRNGPNLIVNYQWSRNRTVSSQSGLVPTVAERAGIFSSLVTDPNNGLPFPGNQIPSDRISPQAKALLQLYPLPNFSSSARYNYQVPIVGNTHQDNLQTRFQQRLPRRNQLQGSFAYSSTRADTANLFDFQDKTRT